MSSVKDKPRQKRMLQRKTDQQILFEVQQRRFLFLSPPSSSTESQFAFEAAEMQ